MLENMFKKVLNPLTQNEYSLKDTFDADEQIKKIPKEIIRNEEYTLISLDVVHTDIVRCSFIVY